MKFSKRYQGYCFLSRSPIALCLAALLCLGWSSISDAQSGIGSIQGTVTDPSGAVLPGAAVHVVNDATHVAVDTKSNSVGFYQVPGLFTGTYQVTVEAPGMKQYATTIQLLVAQTAVINPKLEIGAENQQVVVSADTVQLTTNDSASISSTLENERINQLPENGRDLTTLLTATTPGLDNSGSTMNGMTASSLNYVVDGANATSNNAGGLLYSKTQMIDPDSVQEVHVQSSNGGAQYASPATVVMSTKSGTRDLHGTAFETARNNAFGVANPRAALPGYRFPQLVRNEFGVSAGGPVVIPHVYHGREKTFWFFAYERYSDAEQVPKLTSVPTYGTPGGTGPGSGMNNGDFSTLVPNSGKLQTIYDPSTTANSAKCAASGSGANPYCRTAFPNNQIPQALESPLAKIYFSLVPKPNVANVTNPLVRSNLSYNAITYQVADQQTARIDHVFNENNKTFLRFSHNGSPVNISGGPDNLAANGIAAGAALGYNNNLNNNYSTSLDYTHIFSPTFFIESIYSMQWFSSVKTSGANANQNYEQLLGLPNNFNSVGFPAVKGLIEPLTSSQTNNQANSQINMTWDENLTKILGRHQLLFGGRINHIRQVVLPNGSADSVTFNAQPTGLYQPSSGTKYTGVANTGYADASMFLGTAANYVVNLPTQRVHGYLNEFDAYVQDDFHVTKTLTLNMGLRYEAHPSMWIKGGLANSFDLKNNALVLASQPSDLIAKGYTTQAIITNLTNLGVKFETPQAGGFPSNTSLINDNEANFLPRLGVAWTPFHHGTVFRGGFGQYMNASPFLNYMTHYTQNVPFKAQYTQSYTLAGQAYDGIQNELFRFKYPDPRVPVAGLNSSGVVNTNVTNAIIPGGPTVWGISPDFKPVKVNEANVTIEQPLPGRSALRVTYIYTHSYNLALSDSYNDLPSNYQYEMAYGATPTNTYANSQSLYDSTTWSPGNNWETSNGWSNYNALQVNYQRLYYHGLAYQFAYVWAKSMRAGGNVVGGAASNSTVEPYANYPGALGTKSTMSLIPGGSAPFTPLAPPAPPSGYAAWQDYHDMDRYQLYQLDSSIPNHKIKFNGIYDLPIGRGKRFLRNSPRWLNEIVGGFQIAGLGSVTSQVFNPTSGNWGPVSKIHVYKEKYAVTDCRSGACTKGYLWFNGYISPLSIGANCANAPACVTGLPADYQPYQTPINNDPTNATYFSTDQVNVTYPNGSTNTVEYDGGPTAANYTSKTYLRGPFNWNADLSLFKVFPIKGDVKLRLNFDAFNAFNHQGTTNPGTTDGIVNFLNSANTARQLQITARLYF